jgi:hypothetical protein
MNKKSIVLAVIISAITSSTFCVNWIEKYYDDIDFGSRFNDGDSSLNKFNPYSKKCASRPERANYLYSRRVKQHGFERYKETCCDIREKYDIGHVKKAIIRVAEIVRKYAYYPAQCNKLSDYVFNEASLAAGVGASEFEREYLPLLNVLAHGKDVYKLNRSNPDFRWCDEIAKKYGTKNYYPAVRIVVAHVVAQKIIGKNGGELHNLGSLGDIVFKGLENAGIIVATRDLKKFAELGRHSKNASVSSNGGALLVQYASIGVPIAAVAAAILWFGNKKK